MQNDNRQYNYAKADFAVRPEYAVIMEWIPENSHVIDLGCGNGSLMRYLLDRRNNVSIEGIERAPSGVYLCVKKS